MPKIDILSAVMHIMDRSGAHLSEVRLETDSETCIAYISKHVNPLFSAANARESTFRSASEVLPVIKKFQGGELTFLDMSAELGRQMGELLQLEDDMPVCAMMIVEFVCKKTRHLSIHLIPCAECFAHKIMVEGEKQEVQLYKNMAVLPEKGGDACLIPLEGDMVLHTLCKSGSDFLPDSFLGCDWNRSPKESIDIISEAIHEVVETCFEGNQDYAVAAKLAIIERAPDKGSDAILRLEDVATQAFPENAEAAKMLVELAENAGLPFEPPITKTFAQQTYGKQKMKFESGVSLDMPLGLASDPGAVEVTKNEDGTVDIRIKRQRLDMAN